ncbi:MAG: hydrogenase maturation protease [Planctomycetota bacterium]|jgi:hydrogenase maturation protease
MAAFTEIRPLPRPPEAADHVPVRVLCLGNELLADDALGCVVADELRRRWPALDVVFTTETGFALIDYLQPCGLLVVVDAVRTGNADPGTIYVVGEDDLPAVPGDAPHYVGLFETLALARALDLPVPGELVVVGVEPADLTTIGGAMNPAVRAALPDVLDRVEAFIRSRERCS